VEDRAGDEAVSEFVAQPCQVPCVGCGHRCACLDLKAEYALPAQFGHDVHLAPAVLVAQVVQARSGGAHLKLSAQLLSHERVDDPAEELAVVQDRLRVRPDDGGHQPGVHDVALGREREPLEAVGPPRGK